MGRSRAALRVAVNVEPGGMGLMNPGAGQPEKEGKAHTVLADQIFNSGLVGGLCHGKENAL